MQAWRDFLILLEGKLGKESVEKWLRPLKIVHFDSANLYLEAENSFFVLWFEEHVRSQIRGLLFNNNHRPIKVHLTTREEKGVPKKWKKERDTSPPLVLTPDPLNPAATFENTLCKESTEVLFLCSVAEQKIALGAFNPIYLYGGMGKTHLLMALTHLFRKRGFNALYVRAETFTEHVVNAIRTSQMQTFRQHYRTVDLLLVDDIHLLARKTATQEEFFHTFNALHVDGKQIILSSTFPPPLLEEIEPRLISRFEWGITLHLRTWSRTELREILEWRCKTDAFALGKELIDFLMETFSSPKTIFRAFDALILRTHLEKKKGELDLTTAHNYLKGLIETEKGNALTSPKIIAAVASFFKIGSEDILGKSHAQEYAQPRQIAMYLCRIHLKLPFTTIGRTFNRDHSTVMTSIKQVQNRLTGADQELHFALSEIKRRLGITSSHSFH